MTLVIGSLIMGLILSMLAVGVLISFKVIRFCDITVDGSITFGASVAAVMLVHGAAPWLATLGGFAAGFVAGAAGFVTGVAGFTAGAGLAAGTVAAEAGEAAVRSGLRALARAHGALQKRQAGAGGEPVPEAAQWLLDNWYLAQREGLDAALAFCA